MKKKNHVNTKLPWSTWWEALTLIIQFLAWKLKYTFVMWNDVAFLLDVDHMKLWNCFIYIYLSSPYLCDQYRFYHEISPINSSRSTLWQCICRWTRKSFNLVVNYHISKNLLILKYMIDVRTRPIKLLSNANMILTVGVN